ncbi:MAG: hypothetical protein KC418_18795 [Anaerolineales bacterium]|nr:hypothetical protein [Anaerolineales bacterium]MCB8951158.1 hypothetical protein [Ardenticatenales bacterium]
MDETLQTLITLTGLSDDDYRFLKESADITQEWVDDVITEFYDTLFGYEPTTRVFKPGERPDREETLRHWYMEVTSGQITPEFWQRQWHVGLVHIQRRVSNAFMLGIMGRIQRLFLQKCMATFDPEQAEAIFCAFQRVTDVVAGLIAEGHYKNYVETMELVCGIRISLFQRMIDMEISKKLNGLRNH